MSDGNYDAAINKAVAELRKNPKSSKDIESLERAMNIALEQDNERIRFLKVEGRANAWDEIYLIYKKMSDRQTAGAHRHPDRIRGQDNSMALCRLHAGDGYCQKESRGLLLRAWQGADE
ncbi:MAG: hypothetical protein MZV63_43960 [Marinilabiliales bacterium]|nr:hypothetical protein [Marinilabiliales bacterium]